MPSSTGLNSGLLPVRAKGTTLMAMNSKANQQLITALQQVVAATLKHWLDVIKDEVIQALRDAMPMVQTPAPVTKSVAMAAAEAKREPKFLNVVEVAARWKLHPETVREMVLSRLAGPSPGR